MTFTGQIQDGRIVLPGNPPLPEGASVRIEVYDIVVPAPLVKVRTKPVDKLAQMLMQVGGKGSGPTSATAAHHDRPLHKTSKR